MRNDFETVMKKADVLDFAYYGYNAALPKFAFNAKELDEETGMYYYEARYYKPPVFTSRDAHFESYSSMSPYGYCNKQGKVKGGIYVDKQ